MRSNDKSNRQKASRVKATKAKAPEQKKPKAVGTRTAIKASERKPAPISAPKAMEPEWIDGVEEVGYNELYTLRYDINDRGIGQILLPPSLSTLLQSDRVRISPAAGGLFIKSV